MTMTRSPTEPIGALLRRLRTARGWSQAQLARRASVSTAWVARVELGHRQQPEHDLILRVARAFDVDPAALLASAGYDVDAPASPVIPSVDQALYQLHAAIEAEKQRPVAVRDQDGAIVDLLPPTSAIDAVLDRLELGAEMIAGATRDLRRMLTISERNIGLGNFSPADEENYLAHDRSDSATLAGQLAVDLAAVLPSDLAAAYAHGLASLNNDERLAALNALIAYVRDEERHRGSSRGTRRADAAESGSLLHATDSRDATH